MTYVRSLLTKLAIEISELFFSTAKKKRKKKSTSLAKDIYTRVKPTIDYSSRVRKMGVNTPILVMCGTNRRHVQATVDPTHYANWSAHSHFEECDGIMYAQLKMPERHLGLQAYNILNDAKQLFIHYNLYIFGPWSKLGP